MNARPAHPDPHHPTDHDRTPAGTEHAMTTTEAATAGTEATGASGASAAPVAAAGSGIGVTGLLRRNLALGAFDIVLPMAAYYGLRIAGADQYVALVAGIAVATPRAVFQIVTARKVDLTALLTVTMLVFSLLVGLMTGSPRALAVREGLFSMTAGILGVWMMITVWIGRPVILAMGRSIALTKVGEEGARAWERRWQDDRGFRRNLRVLTHIWGLGLVIDATISLVLACTLPIDLIPIIGNITYWGLFGILLAVHVQYTKAADLRA